VRIVTIPEAGAEKIDLNLCGAAAGRCGSQAAPSPFTADPRVRHAILAGIDREQIVRVIARGRTVVPPDSWISLGEEYIRDPRVPTTGYDPAAADRLLDAAGYRLSPACHGGLGRADGSGRCMDLRLVTTSGNESRAQTQLAVQADLERLGIFTQLSTVKAARLVGGFSDGGLLSTHDFQMAMYTIVGSADPETWYGAYVSGQIPAPANQGAGGDVTGLSDPAVDRAFEEGRASVDLAERTRAYMRAEELLAADLPEIPLYQQVSVMSISSRLIGVRRQDNAWTFNSAEWYCAQGRCRA
jgi:ABC-type transport system substrate-binding protein